MSSARTRRRPFTLALTAAGLLVAGLLAPPAQAAPPWSRTFVDEAGDARHYEDADQLPPVYRTLGEMHEVKVYTQGGRLRLRMNLDVVLDDDANFRQDIYVTFMIGKRYLVAEFGTDQRARLDIETKGGDYHRTCGKQPRQTSSETTDRYEFSVPLSCLPAGKSLKAYVAGTNVLRTNGDDISFMAKDGMNYLNERGLIRIRR